MSNTILGSDHLQRLGIEPQGFAGTNGATTPAPPKKLQPGEVFLHGVVLRPMDATKQNTLAREISALMKAPAYVDAFDPMHAAHVEAVRALMEQLHSTTD